MNLHFYEQNLLDSVSQCQVCIRIIWKVIFLCSIPKEFDTVYLGWVPEISLFNKLFRWNWHVGLKNKMWETNWSVGLLVLLRCLMDFLEVGEIFWGGVLIEQSSWTHTSRSIRKFLFVLFFRYYFLPSFPTLFHLLDILGLHERFSLKKGFHYLKRISWEGSFRLNHVICLLRAIFVPGTVLGDKYWGTQIWEVLLIFLVYYCIPST